MTRRFNLFKKYVFSPWSVVAIFILFGGIHLLVYRGIPIIRNSLIYAQIANYLAEGGGNIFFKNHDYNKPLGFVWISLPFIHLLGANIGLKVVSFFGTVLWSLSIVPFFYRFARYAKLPVNNSSEVTIYTLLVLFNPLVFYQFISAYPDTLFAFAFLWSMYFLDRMLAPEAKWFDGIVFVFASLFALWVKHHACVIPLIFIVFLMSRLKVVKFQAKNNLKALVIWIIGAITLFTAMILIQFNQTTLFNVGHNVKNYISGDNRLEIIINNIGTLKNYIFISFSVLTILLVWWPNFKKYKEWYVTLIIFILSLLFYRGTRLNMRYFIAISPLLVWIIGNNYKKLAESQKAIIISFFVIINFITIFYYNSISFHNFINEQTGVRFNRYDNLRLTAAQDEAQKDIDRINKLVKEGKKTLIFVSGYYGDAEWYIWEREGLFPKELRIIYSRSWDNNILKKNNLKEAIVYERRGIKERNKKIDKVIKDFSNSVRLEK